ncbi:MAG: DUF2726 domain-containing protein [Oscillospiraceae bacterium]|nr:DUF2726 domain-containing protein [Oscillospiraceae bacterium]
MDWIWIIVLAVIVLAIELYRIKKPKQENKPIETEEPKTDYSQSYQRKYLLTRNEYQEYMTLRKIAAEKDLIICPKVRLLDIIEPRKGEKDYRSLFFKVQAKHVDFVICDKELRIKAILELDDNSHDQKNRQARDTFVDQILTSVGYKVIHTRAITDTTLESLTAPQTTEI